MALDLAAGYRRAVPVNAEYVQPYSQAGLNTSVLDFRKRRSARDRAAGLNIGQVVGGERTHPMMPGVPFGSADPNYGGIGDKARWYEGMSHVPAVDAGARQQGLLERYFGADVPPNTAMNRRVALQGVGGLAGAADKGMMDRYASSDTTFSRMNPQEKAAVLSRRDAEKARQAARLGDPLDPTSIAGRMKLRGMQKYADRQARMAGPSFDDMLAMSAARGNVAAMNTLDLSNRRYGDRLKAQADLGAARMGTDADLARTQAGVDIAKLQAEAGKYASDKQFREKTPDEIRAALTIAAAEAGVPSSELQGYSDFIGRNAPSGYEDPVTRDIVASARYGGTLTATESHQVDQLAEAGDPQAIINYGREKRWDDAKINDVLNKALGSRWRSVQDPGGWTGFGVDVGKTISQTPFVGGIPNPLGPASMTPADHPMHPRNVFNRIKDLWTR